MRSNRMAYTKPVIEEWRAMEEAVFFQFETVYVFRSGSTLPGQSFFYTATEEDWLTGDYEFERRKY
jgi:hypothetical protein